MEHQEIEPALKMKPIKNFGEWIIADNRLPDLTRSFQDEETYLDFKECGIETRDSNGMEVSEVVFVYTEIDGEKKITLGIREYESLWSIAEDDFSEEDRKVTHWMPVPEIPLNEWNDARQESPECTEKDMYDENENEEENYLNWTSERVLVRIRQTTGGLNEEKVNYYEHIARYTRMGTWETVNEIQKSIRNADNGHHDTVTHWMFLPQLPKE
jgi:hypothetical protein